MFDYLGPVLSHVEGAFELTLKLATASQDDA